MNKEFVLTTSELNKLQIKIDGFEHLATKPAILYIHGFKGFMDWGFAPFFAERLSGEGYPVIRFNFSHNGIGANSLDFTELDKFAKNSYSLEVAELTELIQAYESGFFGTAVFGKIFLVGHSRGGAIALLTAGKFALVKGCVLWAPISTVDRYSERQKTDWIKKGYLEVLNTRTQQRMRLNKSFLEDIEMNKTTSLNILQKSSELNKPVLIIHGQQDLAVPPDEGEKLANSIGNTFSDFIKIEKTGHTFDITHPFEKCSISFDIVLSKTLEFITKH